MVSKYGWSYETTICLGRGGSGPCPLFSMYAQLLNVNGVFQPGFLAVGSLWSLSALWDISKH